MPGGAIIAAALTDHSARTTALWIGGVDVIKDPAGRYGVPIETIQVNEAGPGGVSRFSCDVEDYLLTVNLATGVPVTFVNLTANVIMFAGVLDTIALKPDFGEQGRTWAISATGVEAYLDWAVTTTDLTFPSPGVLALADLVLSTFANCLGVGPLRAFTSATPTFHGNQAFPVSVFGAMGATPLVALTIPGGTTLREAIRLIAATVYSTPAFDAPGFAWATVDFTNGLRVWTPTPGTPPPVEGPDDYGTMTINNVGGGANVSESLSYTTADALVAGVFVQGNAVSAIVGGGKVGQIAFISDTTLTTVAACTAAGVSYLAQQVPVLRASYQRQDWTPGTTVHVMSFVTISDVRLALVSNNYMVFSIDKTFNDSGRENWTIGFGGLPPSGAALMRRLTRNARA